MTVLAKLPPEDEPPTKDVNFEQEINDLLRLKVLCNPLSGLTEEQLESTSALEFFHRTVTGLLRHSNIASVSYPATSASTAKNSCEGDTGCNNGTSTANGNNNNNSSSSSSTKRPRFQTYPASRNTSLLASLFEACPPLRGQFLQRSFLFERTLSESMIVTGPRFFSRSWREEEERQEEEEEEEEEARAEAEAGPSSSSSSEVRQPPRLAVTDVAALRRELVRKPPRPEAKHQMSAHLHCLYSCGLTSAVPSGVLFRWEDGHGFIESGYGERTPAADWIARGGEGAYPFACSKVYDLREYTRGTKWGPFLDEEVEGEEGEGRGPRVDWEKVEAILIALGTNIRMGRRIEFCPVLKNIWEKPFAGVWASSYIPWWKGGESRREKEWGEMEKKDPYGVSGTWLRLECFLDRSDFVRFNFPPDDTLPGDAPRPPLIASEAMCLLLMRVRVAGIEPPGEGDHKDYPVVHFAGVSRVIDEFNGDGSVDSELRGTVRMTPEGEVRWTASTIYSGQERWKSEGIQLGGIRSARGVVGTWFHKDYDERGPCGPMAFWKVSDSQDKADTRHSHPFDFLCSLTGDLEGEVEVDDNNDDEP